MPESPFAKKKKFREEFGMNTDDANLLTETLERAEFVEAAISISGNAKTTTSFVGTVLFGFLNDRDMELSQSKVTPEHIGGLVKLIDEGAISNNVAKSTVFEEMFDTGKMPTEIVEEKGLKQVSDTGALEEFAKKAIEALPKAVEDVKNGNDKAIGALLVFVMKESKGQANPQKVNEILRKNLS